MCEELKTDVLIVGAGPAGLATAIALKRKGFAGRVLVLDKGRAVGSHVLSGAVIDPSGFKGLLTEEEIAALPFETRVKKESFRFLLGAGLSMKIPWVPPMMQAKGYPLGSLTKLTQALAKIAAAAGVEIQTGYAVTELIEENGVVVGARTGEKGLDAQGCPKSNHLASEEIRATTTVLAEGAAGILTDRLIAEKGLAGARPQSYALGIKELIELPEPRDGGTIMHTFGYPVDLRTYGGGFIYHVSDTQVMVGYAVGLDYRDAELDPHALFRRFKASSAVAPHIAGGKVVAYGAKVIPEGGYYALPKPQAPGVLIVGDGAGLLDGLRIKGVHIALQSGVAAAESIVTGRDYGEILRATKGFREVRRVKNVHGGFTYCAPIGVMMAGFAWATFGRFPFWMVGKRHRDSETLQEKVEKRGQLKCELEKRGGGGQRNVESSIVQPSTSNLQPSASNLQPSTSNLQPSPLTPDRLTDVFLSGTVHEENQPCHLKIRDAKKCRECETRYGSPCTRFCPAEVYRLDADTSVQPPTFNLQPAQLRVDFSNCLHCKTCKVKCPYENVDWTFPQGGDGPRYTRL